MQVEVRLFEEAPRQSRHFQLRLFYEGSSYGRSYDFQQQIQEYVRQKGGIQRSSFEGKAMYKEAIAEMQEASNLSGGSVIWVSGLGYLYARAGRRDKAIKILNELKSRAKREFVPSQAFIWIYAALGDKDQAFVWLEKAYEERSDVMTVLIEERAFDPLRSDPRFQNLIRRIGLPQ